MKNILIMVALTFVLSGCSWFGKGVIKNSFPDLPEKLMEAPAPLKTNRPADAPKIELTDSSPSGIALSTTVELITENYTIANKNKEQLENLQDWLRQQKKLNP